MQYKVWIMFGLLCVVVSTLILLSQRSAADSKDLTGSNVKSSLKFLVVVTRHGNRGGIMDYVSDPYPLKDSKFWPYGSNALTPYGRVQMYNLGKKIRSLYNGFLNTSFYHDELYASSTATSRTVQSGQVFLAGLYPPQGFQIWNKDVLWQPTTLYSNSPDNTQVINDCPKYVVDCDEGKQEFYKVYKRNISQIIDFYNAGTGGNYTNSKIWFLWDKLVSEDVEGYKLPEWTKSFYPEPYTSLIIKEYIAFYAHTDPIMRLLVGNLLGEIVEAMRSKINGSLTDRKLQYYSGHDSTILPLLVMLGIPKKDLTMIKPGSALVLELHEDAITNEFTIQALYIDGTSSDLQPKNIPTPICGEPCLFQELYTNTKVYTQVKFEEECKTDITDFLVDPYS